MQSSLVLQNVLGWGGDFTLKLKTVLFFSLHVSFNIVPTGFSHVILGGNVKRKKKIAIASLHLT